MSDWRRIDAVLPSIPDDWASFADVFVRNGIEGTLQSDRPPVMSGYVRFFSDENLGRLRSELMAAGAARVEVEAVKEEDWSESWKQFFKPQRIGRLLVRPAWEAPGDGVAVEIVIDPGQAFGTGDHPTTRMCLRLLERTLRPGMSVADIGAGSGILSIAAAKLGAGQVDAVDIDSGSVEAARNNAAANGVSMRVHAGRGFEPLGSLRYDLVLSNLISATIIGLAPRVGEHLAEGGRWIVSGIIEANWGDVELAVRRAGFEVEELIAEGEWLAALLNR